MGLWRSNFFEKAAFYGGTALRNFHGLPRFSEDLDFSLIAPNPNFNLTKYLNAISIELNSFGFTVEVKPKEKKYESQIKSAFIKAETVQNFIHIQAPTKIISTLHKNSSLKIKFEIDIDPPAYANYEMITKLEPIPHQVKLYSKPDLFAGKIHAVLCRSWKTRVKGRDFFDFIWFIGKDIPCHLKHLKARMVQSGHLEESYNLTKENLMHLLSKRFSEVNFDYAKKDVRPFIADSKGLDLWDNSFFQQLVERVSSI